MAFYKITGGAHDYTNPIIEHKLAGTYTNSSASCVGQYAFYSASNLQKVSFLMATYIGSYAFGECTNLASVSFPAAVSVFDYAFGSSKRLQNISLPSTTLISNNAFTACTNLTSVFLPGSSVCILGTSVFGFTSMYNRGTIYVPSSLMAEYKSATNWASLSTRFSAIEDYVPE